MPPTQPMFIGFLYRLRAAGVPVGAQEALSLAGVLSAGVHDSTLDGFYFAARALLIHHEGHLDAFDRAFLAEFGGFDDIPAQVTDELRDWLDSFRDELGGAQAGPDHLANMTLEELLELFRQRMAEQKERHDGGSYWIGTQGSSPFGQAGKAQSGLSTGSSGGGRTAIHVADARAYRPYRSDLTLDIRQLEVALRRLRSFVREGADFELDIERTVDETARNAGEIEVVTRPPSRPNTHVILMIDVGGSMTPYSQLMSQLFSATKKATHFKELRTYYFHNCVYGRVYETERMTEPRWVHDLLRECASHYKLIMVGDASMAPYELRHTEYGSVDDRTPLSGVEWLHNLAQHFSHSVWLNPEPVTRWGGTTIDDIRAIFEMYPMTVDGLTDAMA
ncbi:MAG: VWA domain-containing protein, partial [Actinomycetes bacterium]